MSKKDYGRLTLGIIALWFVFSIWASAAHVFKQSSAAPPIALGLSVAVPLLVFWLWFKTSVGFREFALSLDPQTLTILQSWRIAGFAFVALYVYGILPGIFANPAGWGDIFIGLTAPWVALELTRQEHRGAFITWNVLGMLDLVTAVTLGTTSRLINVGGLAADAMTVLPLSIVPTFLVPLFFIMHIIVIAHARRWPAVEGSRNRQRVAASAA